MCHLHSALLPSSCENPSRFKSSRNRQQIGEEGRGGCTPQEASSIKPNNTCTPLPQIARRSQIPRTEFLRQYQEGDGSLLHWAPNDFSHSSSSEAGRLQDPDGHQGRDVTCFVAWGGLPSSSMDRRLLIHVPVENKYINPSRLAIPYSRSIP